MAARKKRPVGISDLGDRIFWARTALRGDLSQEKFAELAGLTRLQVQALEAGRHKGNSVEIRAGLALGFGVTTETLNSYLGGAFGQATFKAAQQFVEANEPIQGVLDTALLGLIRENPARAEGYLGAERRLETKPSSQISTVSEARELLQEQFMKASRQKSQK